MSYGHHILQEGDFDRLEKCPDFDPDEGLSGLVDTKTYKNNHGLKGVKSDD
jgi:hypothetical protein